MALYLSIDNERELISIVSKLIKVAYSYSSRNFESEFDGVKSQVSQFNEFNLLATRPSILWLSIDKVISQTNPFRCFKSSS